MDRIGAEAVTMLNPPRTVAPLATLVLALAARPAHAGEPVTQDVRVVDGGRRVALTLAWRNAFRDERNHDAVWVVLRPEDGSLGPHLLAGSGHSATGTVGGAEVAGEVVVPADGVGAFVQPASACAGDARLEVVLALREPLASTPEVWTVAMVYVPGGPFELGDDHPEARKLGSFFAAGGDGAAAGPFTVANEDALAVGTGPGELAYLASQYTGDGQGPIPAAFPKGTRAFYVARHELRQGAYARFLDALPGDWPERRRPDLLPDDTEEAATGTIALTDDGFRAAAPRRPCNLVTWDDTCAYLDFLGLRPMTELEFEKAARGPERPAPLDFPWGTSAVGTLERRVTSERDLVLSSDDDEAGLDLATLARFGASYYRVLDLSGSLWERVISAGHPAGRAFEGSHGDGVLDAATGDATNPDWPRGTRAAPGIGFRGGAEYFGEPSLTNPYSPVGVRTFAAYDGAHRYKTYSARGCRTAPGE